MKRILLVIPGVLLLALMLPYLRHTEYLALSESPFSGEGWYNPYQNLQDTLLKANFHAHSRSWAGITWGANTDEEMIGAYAEKAYHVPALSNYHRITPRLHYPDSLIYVPVYEHGYNMRKVHCLCIGAIDVGFADVPLHLNLAHTQRLVHDLQARCSLIAFAHPGRRSAHTPEEVASLSGFHLIEVIFPRGVATDYWDAVLSRGRAVWLLANDDTHDMATQGTFLRWNMIYARQPDAGDALKALRNGSHYGVLSYDGLCEDNRIEQFDILDDTLHIALRDTFNRIDLYGQDGVTLHSQNMDRKVSYLLKSSDTYVRVEVHHDHCVMYLNPVIRYDGITPPQDTLSIAPVDHLYTWLMRGLVFCIIAGVVFLWYGLLKRTGNPTKSKTA